MQNENSKKSMVDCGRRSGAPWTHPFCLRTCVYGFDVQNLSTVLLQEEITVIDEPFQNIRIEETESDVELYCRKIIPARFPIWKVKAFLIQFMCKTAH